MLVLYFEVSVAAVFCIYILYQPYKRQNTMALPMTAWSQVLVQLEAGITSRRQHRVQFLHNYLVFRPAPSLPASFLRN